jgi:protein TonB
MINPYILGFFASVLLHIGVFFLVVESQQQTIEYKKLDVVPVNFIAIATPPTNFAVSASIKPMLPLMKKSLANESAKQNEPRKAANKNVKRPSQTAKKTVLKQPEKKIAKTKTLKEKPIAQKTIKPVTDKILDDMIKHLEKSSVAESKPVKKAVVAVKKERPTPTSVRKNQPKPMAKRKAAMTNQPQLEASFKQRLQKLIASNKKYPARAKRNGEAGRVQVSFVIYANGQINHVRVVKSSGSTSLDQATIKLLKKVSGQLTFPNNLQKKQWQLTLPIEYRLR